ncbi:MAG: hypothetical protein FD133_770 [Erysipelotrichaceae bacterium]|nr:MAG: hypothetical protein FD179_1211 [Erysipelotrichaceae bacterium]TXT18611.1 MAG: hypothetical protein FD133_770 [Erysipelotrichaceae bacterium]
MKVTAQKDHWINIGFIFIIVVLISSVMMVKREEMVMLSLLVIPCIALLLWIYFKTYYEFRDEVLYCKSGPFYEKIRYDSIKSIKLCENFMSSMALSRQRIEIKQHKKNYIVGTTYISPIDREDFLYELKRRCHHLDI